ncbi:ufaA1, partial [Cucurbita argyrosperma subsp. argyrosperma]
MQASSMATFSLLNNPKHTISSLTVKGARLFVTRFLGRYISTGSLIWGEIFTFEGTITNSFLQKVVLKVHSSQFYWKVMTEADLGLADAYINGEFSLMDKEEGLLNLILGMVVSSTIYGNYSICKNTIAQARKNISRHYDLVSNELFSLFLDDTMMYSCAIFKREDEDLRIAQLRKISVLIKKARINKKHKVLDIGCGWGTLAIEIVKQTGCHCTGITFGMIEAVGHEFMEDFFGSCESVLQDNGLLVLQFISVPDESYEEYRLSAGFIKEYIFQGGCLPSLSRITTAMTSASRL